MCSSEDNLATEELVYEFIRKAVGEASTDSPLCDLEVHDHFYRKIEQDAGVRVGEASGQLSPTPGGESFGEYNVQLLLVVYARIEGTQKDGPERIVARRHASQIAKAVAQLFWDNPSCDERFRDTRCYDFVRGFDSLTKSDHFAVVNLTLLVNEVGQAIGG